MSNIKNFLRCPCCGYPTLPSRNNQEICYLCSWQDDGQDDEDSNLVYGGPNNDYSLDEARQNFKKYHIMFRPSDPDFYKLRNEKTDSIKLDIINIFQMNEVIDETIINKIVPLIKKLKKEEWIQFNKKLEKKE